MFLGRKNQHCENDYATKYILQIQCSSYQITNIIFYRTRTKNFTVHVETQKALNTQDLNKILTLYSTLFTTYPQPDMPSTGLPTRPIMIMQEKFKYRLTI